MASQGCQPLGERVLVTLIEHTVAYNLDRILALDRAKIVAATR